ncbi:hypothetical protein SCTVLC_1484 [Serratia symbiotica SCt-VLC]|uniref:Uncharacterized protein n=1 Tax=Serratia symbiotica SCt-VLC TaxID=1347341 RepID=A0A068RBZ7_9GAMM|nr:hypothetical protein SCTVLC_1484 [Serratia symbiotica SCt-VLC]
MRYLQCKTRNAEGNCRLIAESGDDKFLGGREINSIRPSQFARLESTRLFIKELAKCDLSTHLKTARECFIYKLCVDTLSIRLHKELTMIYSNVKTHYISGGNNSRLVRYDVIEKNSDVF